MTMLDKMLYALLALAAVTLAVMGFCPWDWLWALATLGVIFLWTRLITRRRKKRERSSRL